MYKHFFKRFIDFWITFVALICVNHSRNTFLIWTEILKLEVW